MSESKIQLTDTLEDVLIKMSEKNPGALMAMMSVIKECPQIDPQGFAGGMGPILLCDTLGIYGTDIYILFNDKCDRNVRTFVMLFRAVQFGLLDRKRLQTMSKDQNREVNLTEDEWSSMDAAVCKRLSDFSRATTTADVIGD